MTDGATVLPMPDAKWHRHDPDYIRSLLERANLSQRAAAKLLGITDRSMRYYVSGDQPVPYTVQFALEVLAGGAAVKVVRVDLVELDEVGTVQGSVSMPTTPAPPQLRTVWHDAAERPLKREDAGKMLVGRDRFDNPISGYVTADAFGVTVREPAGLDSRTVSADRISLYALLDPPPTTR